MKRCEFPVILPKEFQSGEPDFRIVFNDCVYKVQIAMAVRLSSRIAFALRENAAIHTYTIPNTFPVKGDFNLISQYLAGHSIDVPIDEYLFVYSMAAYLSIETLMINDFTYYIIASDCSEEFMQVASFLFDAGADVSSFTTAMRIRFAEIYKTRAFRALQPGLLDLILRDLASDSFTDEINELSLELGGRLLKYLDLRTFEKYYIENLISDASINLNYLKTGLIHLIDTTSNHIRAIQFPFRGDNQLSGILQHLSSIGNGNPAKRGLISIKSSNPCGRMYQVDNILNHSAHRSSFKTRADEIMWFIIDFKSHPVSINAYTVGTLPASEGNIAPSSWTLSGSNDGNEWVELDVQHKVHLEGLHTFVLSRKSESFTMIRFKHEEIEAVGKAPLCMSCFEIFGTITK